MDPVLVPYIEADYMRESDITSTTLYDPSVSNKSFNVRYYIIEEKR